MQQLVQQQLMQQGQLVVLLVPCKLLTAAKEFTRWAAATLCRQLCKLIISCSGVVTVVLVPLLSCKEHYHGSPTLGLE
jgi:hypothetical protein